jgi:hypothetical protein
MPFLHRTTYLKIMLQCCSWYLMLEFSYELDAPFFDNQIYTSN